MSVTSWQYLGPYAEVILNLKEIAKDVCTQPKNCPNPVEGPFCPQCGILVKNRFHTFLYPDPDLQQFLGRELQEVLFIAEGMNGSQKIGEDRLIYRVLGNIDRNDPREFVISQNDMWVDISSLDIPGEIAWFKKAFAPEFMKIQEMFGGIQFKWGYIQFYW